MILSAQVHNLNKETAMDMLELIGTIGLVMLVCAFIYWVYCEHKVDTKRAQAETARLEAEAARAQVEAARAQAEREKFLEIRYHIYDWRRLEHFLSGVGKFQRHCPEAFLEHAESVSWHFTQSPVVRERTRDAYGHKEETTEAVLVIEPYSIVLHRHTRAREGTCVNSQDEGYRGWIEETDVDIVVSISDPISHREVDLMSLSEEVRNKIMLGDLGLRLVKLGNAANADLVVQQQEEAAIVARETERQRLETAARLLREQQEQQQRDRLAQDIIRRHQPPPGE